MSILYVLIPLALLLLGGSWRQLLLVITGFTLGHSITLSLAALGILRPNGGFIEALIGLSIALVAVENISSQNGSARSSARVTALILLAELPEILHHWVILDSLLLIPAA